MGKRPGVHHGCTAVDRVPDRSRIQQVMAVEAVITDDFMTQVFQMSCYRGTHVTAIPRDQNPHNPMIGAWPTAVPTNIARAVVLKVVPRWSSALPGAVVLVFCGRVSFGWRNE